MCYYFLSIPISSLFHGKAILIVCAFCSFFLPCLPRKLSPFVSKKWIYNIHSRLKSGPKSPIIEPLLLTEESCVSFLFFFCFLLAGGRGHLVRLVPHRPRHWWHSRKLKTLTLRQLLSAKRWEVGNIQIIGVLLKTLILGALLA